MNISQVWENQGTKSRIEDICFSHQGLQQLGKAAATFMMKHSYNYQQSNFPRLRDTMKLIFLQERVTDYQIFIKPKKSQLDTYFQQ